MPLDPSYVRSPGTIDDQERNRVGVLFVILSAACFGALGVLSQLAYHAGVCVLGLLSGRFVLAAAILWLAVAGLRRPVSWNRGIAVGLAVGAGYSGNALCFAAALTHIQAGLADVIVFIYPAMVTVGATAIGRERWSRRRSAALVSACAGVALAVAGAACDPAGVGFALGAAVIYAAYVLVSSSLLGELDPLVLSALLATGAAAVLSAAAFGRGDLALQGGAYGAAMVAAVAVVSSVLGVCAFLAGVRRLGAARASIVSSAEPALTAAFALAVFGDRIGLVEVLGAALVLASVPILERKPRPTCRIDVTPAFRPA
jgi:drug/metabolite transporter (DMT)-like permease